MPDAQVARGGIWLDAGDGSWVYLELLGVKRGTTELHVAPDGPPVRVPDVPARPGPNVEPPDEVKKWIPQIPTRVLGIAAPVSIELSGDHDFGDEAIAELEVAIPSGARLGGVIQVEVDEVAHTSAHLLLDSKLLVDAVVRQSSTARVPYVRLTRDAAEWRPEDWGLGSVHSDG